MLLSNPLVLPTDLRAKLAAFEARHRRPIRVLHIGNVANNAFHNASLLRRAGLECDVVCWNYYHIMGCPEWEEADFDRSPPGGDFAPEWHAIDLHGFRRPRWFAQGPLTLCLDYLLARRAGQPLRSAFLWRLLEFENRTASPTRSLAAYCTGLSLIGPRFLDALRRAVRHPDPGSAVSRRMAPLEARVGPWATVPLRKAALAFVALLRWTARMRRERVGRPEIKAGEAKTRARVTELVARFAEEFPDRGDRLAEADLAFYEWNLPRWRQLFAHYDVVIGYATDPAWPLMAELPYFALEHGTLRDIPFAPDAEGRRTALMYRLAEHVFVTNHDCLENASRLARDRVSFINHPYDEDLGMPVEGWEAIRADLARTLDADFLVFAPTRHDWMPGTGYADKANDRLLRAFCSLRRSGLRIGIVLCEWGANVEASKRLLAEGMAAAHAVWLPPLGLVQFQRVARACHVVADQFKLGAFGGVTFKALSAGAPVLTRLDEPAILARYPEVPPVINCSTEDEIAQALRHVANAPERLAALARTSREWIKRHHSGARTAERQLREFVDFLDWRDRAGREPIPSGMSGWPVAPPPTGKPREDSHAAREVPTAGLR